MGTVLAVAILLLNLVFFIRKAGQALLLILVLIKGQATLGGTALQRNDTARHKKILFILHCVSYSGLRFSSVIAMLCHSKQDVFDTFNKRLSK